MREELLRIADDNERIDGVPEVSRRLRALAERAPAGETVTDVGTWLCGKLMEHCRASGLTPATQNKLFALCDEARKTFPPSQPVADRCHCLPDEWVAVPPKMTLEMDVAWCEQWYSRRRSIDDADSQDCYAAMLAAAPEVPRD